MTRLARGARARRIIWLGVRIALAIALLERQRRRLPDDRYQELARRVWQREAIRLRRTALELQGLLIKLGQFLSTRVDVLPPSFTHELSGLRDMVPPVEWDLARAVAEAELGRPLGEVFEHVEPRPLASASLGQAHRATLHGGATVAIKVQRPGVEELIEVDLQAVLTVVRWARRLPAVERRVDLLALYGELARTTREELDYLLEADHAERFARNFAAQEAVRVPAIHREWTSRRLLVMDYMEGLPVDDRAGIVGRGLAPAAVAESLLATYLEQVLRDGFFHADPHPGNVWVDGAGRLIYLDFGMMGEITPAERRAMGAFAVGVVRRDLDGLVASLRDLGFLRPHAEAAPLKRAMGIALDQMAGIQWSRPSGAAFEEFLDDMRDFLRTEPFQLPTQYTFLGRAAGILLGITAALDPNLDLVRVLRDHAFAPLGLDGAKAEAPGGARPGAGGLNWEAVRKELTDLGMLLYRLPHRLDRLLQNAEAGDLRLHLDLGAVPRRLEERNRALDRLSRAALAIAAGVISTWLLVSGHVGDARLGWLITALLLLWTLRGTPGTRRGGPH